MQSCSTSATNSLRAILSSSCKYQANRAIIKMSNVYFCGSRKICKHISNSSRECKESSEVSSTLDMEEKCLGTSSFAAQHAIVLHVSPAHTKAHACITVLHVRHPLSVPGCLSCFQASFAAQKRSSAAHRQQWKLVRH